MDDKDWRKKAPLWGACLLMALLAHEPAQGSGPQESVMFRIPAGDAKKTLLKFYEQSGVQALYLSDDVQGRKTQAVSGTYAPAQALKKMLQGTGLVFEFEHAGAAIIKAQAVFTPLETLSVAAANDPPALPEVLVTGSWIRGVLDIPSPIVHVTREELKRSAYATVHDAMQHLPLNARAMQNEDFGGTGNYARGTGLNLRGLGSGATLVLVNGRRQASAGYEGDFVDVSNIPWSAIEEIEILPDGTSALYGSDAIAGVVNIKMREDLDQPETVARIGSAIGGGAETLVSQLFGDRWQTGKYFFAYQYSERTALDASERPYTADSDKRPFGGRNFSSIASSPGNLLDPATLRPVFAIPANQDGSSLEPGDLLPGVVNYENTFTGYQLLPDRKMHSAYFSAKQRVNERFELFGEGRFSQVTVHHQAFFSEAQLPVPSTNPFFVDPFGDMPYVIVAYSFLDDLGVIDGLGKTRSFTSTLGVNGNFSHGWQATLSGSIASEKLNWRGANVPDFDALFAALADPNPETAFNPFGSGSNTNPATIEKIRTSYFIGALSRITTGSFVIDGPLFDLPAGPVKLAVGNELRHEIFARGAPRRAFDRQAISMFSELSFPLIENFSDASAPARLEASVAGRYERYSDFGDTFNPKIGLRWNPLNSFKLRTTWGTSFRAPKLTDLYDEANNATGMVSLNDPKSPSGQSIILGRQGNNPNLREETATTWLAGVDISPEALSHLALSLTYFSINYRNQVVQPSAISVFDILLHEDAWSSVINRNPTSEQIASICNSPDFFGSTLDCESSAPAAIIDFRLRNLTSTSTQGVNLKLDYVADTKIGNFRFGLDGSYVLSFEQTLSETAPTIDVVDTVYNPLQLRMRSTVDWQFGGRLASGLSLFMSIAHVGGYRDPESPTISRVEQFTTVDLGARYQLPTSSSEWSGMEFGFNISNALDESPPFVDRAWGYDTLNSNPTGRVVNLYLQKSW